MALNAINCGKDLFCHFSVLTSLAVIEKGQNLADEAFCKIARYFWIRLLTTEQNKWKAIAPGYNIANNLLGSNQKDGFYFFAQNVKLLMWMGSIQTLIAGFSSMWLDLKPEAHVFWNTLIHSPKDMIEMRITSELNCIFNWYGRRVAFLCAALPQIIFLNLIPFCTYYSLYCIGQILAGGLQYGAYLTAFIIVMELFGGFPKTVFGIWAHGIFSFGYWYVGPMAYLIRDWRYLQWSASFLAFLYLPYYWIFPESIRWLIVNDRPKEAKVLVLKAAKWNGVTIPEPILEKELSAKEQREKVSVLALFQNKKMAIVTLIVFFTWMVDSLCYYGLSWNIAWLPGNTYANFVLSGTTDIVSYLLCIPFMEYLGRRWTLSGFFVVGGVCLIVSGFTENRVTILLTLIGRFTIAANFGITYIYSAEIFPTVVRNSASGFSSVVSRIGAISAPQIALLSDYYYTWLPVVIYGSFGLLAGVVDYFLPETVGKPMTETIEEGVDFVQNANLISCRMERKKNDTDNVYITTEKF